MKFIILSIIFSLPVYLFGQNVLLTYNVSERVERSGGVSDPGLKLTLKYTGYLYRKNNRYIYYEKPAFTQKVDGGSIVTAHKGNTTSMLEVNTDSLQYIVYGDYDSLLQRMSKLGYGGNYLNKFERDCMAWQLSPTIKTINGLRCQLAIYSDQDTGIEQWKVWFCADIPFDWGVFLSHGLPGMVVQADYFPLNKHYELQSQFMTAIDDKHFWPQEFNQPFEYVGVCKKYHPSNDKKSKKAQKKEALLNSNL